MKKFVSLLSLFCFLILTGRVMAYSVSITPNSQTVFLGNTTQVDVNLMLGPGQQLFGFNLGLTFNPAVLQFNNLVFTNLLLADYTTGFTAPPTISDNLVTFDGALNWPVLAGTTSDIVPLATLYFTSSGLGTSPLDLSGTALDFNSLLEEQLITSGSLTVVPSVVPTVPEPGTFLLLGAGLASMVALRRKFNKA